MSSSEWKTAKLSEIAQVQTGPFGSQLHQKDYVDIGTPIITVEHLGDNRILHIDLPKVTDDDRTRLSKYSLKMGDIVFSRVGSVDRRALVRNEEDGWLFSGRCLRVRPNIEFIDSTYLSYYYGLKSFKEYIRAIAVGATMPSLNTEIMSNLHISFPPLPEQKRIAEILGSLDDKIELNRRMNETLESIARAIFKSWFVDFDPVRAKMEGKQPVGMDAKTAALFPDHFEDSALGPIPAGWRVGKLGDIIVLEYGKALKGENRTPGIIPVYGSNGQVGWNNTSLVIGPGIVVGRKGNPGFIKWVQKDFFPIDTTFFVKPTTKINLHWIYFALSEINLPGLGADSAVPGLNRNIAYLSEMILPDIPLSDAFKKTFCALFEQIELNFDENITLENIREVLLPELLATERFREEK